MQVFGFEQAADRYPLIRTDAEGGAMARFLMSHASRPQTIESLLRTTDSVLAGLTARETIEAGCEQLELDGSQYVARAKWLDPAEASGQTSTMPLGEFRDLLTAWRDFIADRWQEVAW